MNTAKSTASNNAAINMKTEVLDITPAMANRWMIQNTRNRNLSRKKVRTYVADMLAGAWTLHHQGIGFYDNGVLADGQHRLQAIIESGVTVPMLVTYGMPYAIGADIDRHRPRSETDAIRIGGLSDWMGITEISVIKAILNFHASDGARSFSTKEVVSWGKYLRENVQFAVKCFPHKAKHLTVAPVMAAIAIAAEYEDKRRLKEFAEILLSGMPHSNEDSAAMRLRDKLMTRARGTTSKDRIYITHDTMRAIEAFCKRKHMKQLHTPTNITKMIYKSKIVESRMNPESQQKKKAKTLAPA